MEKEWKGHGVGMVEEGNGGGKDMVEPGDGRWKEGEMLGGWGRGGGGRGRRAGILIRFTTSNIKTSQSKPLITSYPIH